MPQIQILPTLVANQIAAGEVVQRPASIVKELVENSLDAGATSIHLDIVEGGKDLIRIRDDGCGIARDQLTLALAPHATSKLRDISDLESIISYGFRGEALASISSVSKLTLISRTADAESGWKIYNQGKEYVTASSPTAHPVGTTIEVAELFYNTPARLKFMSKPTVEYNHIEDVVQRMALIRPEIDFTLTHNGKQKLRLRREKDYAGRLAQLFPRVFADPQIVRAQSERFNLKMEMVFCPTSVGRNLTQFSYVNGRMIKDKILISAIKQAFQELYANVSYNYVLFLTLDQNALDVNVHPTKAEVHFADARAVHSFIFQNIYYQLALYAKQPESSIQALLDGRQELNNLLDRQELQALRDQIAQQEAEYRLKFSGQSQAPEFRRLELEETQRPSQAPIFTGAPDFQQPTYLTQTPELNQEVGFYGEDFNKTQGHQLQQQVGTSSNFSPEANLACNQTQTIPSQPHSALLNPEAARQALEAFNAPRLGDNAPAIGETFANELAVTDLPPVVQALPDTKATFLADEDFGKTSFGGRRGEGFGGREEGLGKSKATSFGGQSNFAGGSRTGGVGSLSSFANYGGRSSLSGDYSSRTMRSPAKPFPGKVTGTKYVGFENYVGFEKQAAEASEFNKYGSQTSQFPDVWDKLDEVSQATSLDNLHANLDDLSLANLPQAANTPALANPPTLANTQATDQTQRVQALQESQDFAAALAAAKASFGLGDGEENAGTAMGAAQLVGGQLVGDQLVGGQIPAQDHHFPEHYQAQHYQADHYQTEQNQHNQHQNPFATAAQSYHLDQELAEFIPQTTQISLVGLVGTDLSVALIEQARLTPAHAQALAAKFQTELKLEAIAALDLHAWKANVISCLQQAEPMQDVNLLNEGLAGTSLLESTLDLATAGQSKYTSLPSWHYRQFGNSVLTSQAQQTILQLGSKVYMISNLQLMRGLTKLFLACKQELIAALEQNSAQEPAQAASEQASSAQIFSAQQALLQRLEIWEYFLYRDSVKFANPNLFAYTVGLLSGLGLLDHPDLSATLEPWLQPLM